MRITYHKELFRFIVTYDDIEVLPYIRDLYAQDYRLRFGVERHFQDYVALAVEADTIGATFLINPDQTLWRPFYKLAHVAEHGLDCLPWYQVKGRTWPLQVNDFGTLFTLKNFRWSLFQGITALKQLREV